MTPLVTVCPARPTGNQRSAARWQHGERSAQDRVGFHHVCFRARAGGRDERHRFLVEIDATIVHPADEGAWAPGCCSVLFEDPDGIRLEMNHVPGKGLLAQT